MFNICLSIIKCINNIFYINKSMIHINIDLIKNMGKIYFFQFFRNLIFCEILGEEDIQYTLKNCENL